MNLFAVPAGRTAKWVVFFVTFVVFAGFAGQGGKFERAQKNETSSFLPGSAESVRALEQIERFPGGEQAPAVIVYERRSGLTAADKRRIRQTVGKLDADRRPLVGKAQPPVFSPNGRAAIVIQPVEPGDGQGDTFQTAVQSIRDRAGGSGGGLQVKVTGAAGYSLDAIKVFGNINGSLLLVAALIVLILLIAIYRSPIFWIIPFFTVLLAEGASRGLGYLLAEAGVTINGQSGGILPVLVFGAGTDYALLLVSRYREELRRHEDKHEAMAIALQSAGPAILASGLTVIAALLTLSIAEVNGTAGLGPIGAMGVALAMISMLTMLPAALTICGRKWFWPRIPHLGEAGVDETHGVWRRIGDRVAVRPRAVWITGSIVLAILAANLLNLDTGLTSGNSFRGEVDSVQGQQILARNFPAGASAPTDVIVPDRGRAAAVADALAARTDLVSEVSKPIAGAPGARLRVTLAGAPYDTKSLAQLPELRRVARHTGGKATLVGGPTAQEYDLRQSAARDNRVIIPLTLVGRLHHPRGPAARAARAAAPHPLGDPQLRRRARLRRVRVGRGLRLPRRRSHTPAAVLRLPRSAGDRLQHLPHGARARGGDQARHARGHAARPRSHRRRDHRRRHRARRHLRRARRAAARRADRDRPHRRLRRPARHVHRARRDRPRARDGHRPPHVVAVAAVPRKGAFGLDDAPGSLRSGGRLRTTRSPDSKSSSSAPSGSRAPHGLSAGS